MKLRYSILAFALLASGIAHAGEPHFPGPTHFTSSEIGTDDKLLQSLYGGSTYQAGADNPLCKPDCTLTVRGRLSWKDASNNHHLGAVIIAEPHEDTAAHADGGYIGMVDFVQVTSGWVLNAGSPIVAEEGGFGKAPPIQIVSGGIFGMVVITKPGFSNQGETEQNWNMYVLTHGNVFLKVLSVPIMRDNSGKCDDDRCRQNDFTADAQVSDEGRKLFVRVTTHPLHGQSTFKDFVVIP